MNEVLLPALVNLGAPGIVGGILLWIILRLYKEVKELQDKRIDEMKEGLTALTANTTALAAMTQQINATSRVIQSLSAVLLSKGQQ